MFIGHVAVGLATGRAAPRVPLGWLVAAPLFVDLVWPLFLLSGVERVRIDPGNTASTPLDFVHYPWTHSLVMGVAWGLLLGLGYRLRHRDPRGAVAVGLLVVSHWVLDAATHRPDLPLTPWGGGRVGLGLWNAPAAALAVELAMFAAGVLLYARGTRGRDAIGGVGFWALAVTLLLLHVGNLAGAPPPNERALAWVALAVWLFVAWAAWVGKHRESTAAA